MNHYETVFILTPVLSDAQMKEAAVEKFTKVLTDNGATIVNEEIWGLRKLAYPIDKKSTGFYSLVENRRRSHNRQENRNRIPPRRTRDPLPRIPRNHKYAWEYANERRSLRAGKAVETVEAAEKAPEA